MVFEQREINKKAMEKRGETFERIEMRGQWCITSLIFQSIDCFLLGQEKVGLRVLVALSLRGHCVEATNWAELRST